MDAQVYPAALPPQLAIMIPAWNERDNLELLLPAVREELASLGLAAEIVVVVGGSRDGWLVVFVPTAVILHRGGQSEGKVKGGLLTLSGTLGERYYIRKHRSTFPLFPLKCLLVVEF